MEYKFGDVIMRTALMQGPMNIKAAIREFIALLATSGNALHYCSPH